MYFVTTRLTLNNTQMWINGISHTCKIEKIATEPPSNSVVHVQMCIDPGCNLKNSAPNSKWKVKDSIDIENFSQYKSTVAFVIIQKTLWQTLKLTPRSKGVSISKILVNIWLCISISLFMDELINLSSGISNYKFIWQFSSLSICWFQKLHNLVSSLIILCQD